MAKDSAALFLFEDLFEKPVVSIFDSELRTSDGGPRCSARSIAAQASARRSWKRSTISGTVAG